MKREVGGARGLRRIVMVGLAGIVLAASAVLPVRAATAGTAVIEGVWLTEKKSEMTIAPCGQNWCGYITRIVVPAEIKAKYGDDLEKLNGNYTDVMNPDPALRDRPILGLKLLTLIPTGNAKNYRGEIYNPEDGKNYEGKIKVVNANTLTLEGCVMFGMLCQGEDWKRIAGPPAAATQEVASAD